MLPAATPQRCVQVLIAAPRFTDSVTDSLELLARRVISAQSPAGMRSSPGLVAATANS